MAGSYLAFDVGRTPSRSTRRPSRPTTILAQARHVGRDCTSCRWGPRTGRHPHMADEVYVVLQGRGRLRVVDEEVEVKPGIVISVDHGEEHQFVEVSEDLQMLVVFAPPDLPDEA